MKTKSFQDYLKKRFDKKEIAEIKAQAKLEARMIKSLQKILADTTNRLHEKKYTDYQESLIERLKDPVEAQSYLSAALQDKDEQVFLLALRDVLQAHGSNIPLLAEK